MYVFYRIKCNLPRVVTIKEFLRIVESLPEKNDHRVSNFKLNLYLSKLHAIRKDKIIYNTSSIFPFLFLKQYSMKWQKGTINNAATKFLETDSYDLPI